MQINFNEFLLYFGSKNMSVQSHEVKTERILPVHESIKNMLGAKSIYFCQQVHGVQGYLINSDFIQKHPAFSLEGDFLYSSEKQCALGILTADCLPIVIYHPRGVISVIHAGWKGSFENIVEKALVDMQESYKDLDVCDVKIFLGPSGKVCCYEVQDDFMQQFLQKYPWSQTFFIKKDAKIYFDNPGFTMYILQKIGILPQNIYTKWNLCTICDENYCSYRRERQQAGRNITLVMLKASP